MQDYQYLDTLFHATTIPGVETELLALGARPLFFRKQFRAAATVIVGESHRNYCQQLARLMADEEISMKTFADLLHLSWGSHQVRWLLATGGPIMMEAWNGKADHAGIGPLG